uniref:Ig-like domain-containing protein n=1 Tax=Timema monikensis TaxID=170555 RepID=A0A7R9HM04_9NEOP|nr:unnamed protein product [Timema monikensis]
MASSPYQAIPTKQPPYSDEDCVNFCGYRVSEHRGIVAPAIVEHTGTVHVSQDEGAVLLCVSQGCPSPDYRWFNLNSGGGEPEPVLPGPRTRLLGPILVIEAVTAEDASMYRCSASNAGGEASAELRLVVSTPLHVEVILAQTRTWDLLILPSGLS